MSGLSLQWIQKMAIETTEFVHVCIIISKGEAICSLFIVIY